jgi:hypothetical protein
MVGVVSEVDVRQLSLDELRQIKLEWYQMAVANRVHDVVRLVAISFGQKVSDGYEYEHDENGQRITFQADRHFKGVLVRVNGKRVMDNRQDMLFVPGAWELVLDRLHGKVQASFEDQNKKAREEALRQTLIEELLLEE